MSRKETEPQKYHPTGHGPEIFPRRFILTTEEQQWRKSTTLFLQEHLPSNDGASLVSTSPILKESRVAYEVTPARSTPTAKKVQQKALRERLTEILKTLRVVNEILKIQYGSPDWGNQPHIIDELVYILLTRRSKIEDAKRHFEAIKEKYPIWEEVICASPYELKAIIRGGGLEGHKVQFIQGSLQAMQQEFGRINEIDFVNMPDEVLGKFLRKLPGVGPKSSACVLMYTRNTDIFPADTHCIRVLNRLGLFKAFGFDWNQENHKQAEKELLLLIPPHMRSDLHRNLLALGREICKPKPLCDSCELKKFCAYYRTKAQAAHAEEKKSLAIDMFCGAGGFSLGLRRAGFKIVAAIDNNPDAILTYRLNHPDMPNDTVIESDARKIDVAKLCSLLRGQRLDLLAGGPPCQGFSMMGNRVPHKFENGNKKFGSNYNFVEDERNHLFEAMIDVARELRPRYVVIENVPGLGSAKVQEKSYAQFIKEKLEEIDYKAEIILLEASDFGVPQRRHRYFIFGAHGNNKLPNLKMLADGIPEKERTNLEHALYDLPQLGVADGKWIATYSNGVKNNHNLDNKYLGRFQIKGKTKVLYSHISRFNNEDDLKLFKNLQQGEDYQQLIERIGWQDFTKYSDEHFHDKYYRLKWDGKSKTIVSHLHKDGNGYIHPFQTRSLSVREAARIQSFPDDYIFCGSRGAQFIQIGNAVPPVMARAIGEILIEALANAEKLNK